MDGRGFDQFKIEMDLAEGGFLVVGVDRLIKGGNIVRAGAAWARGYREYPVR